MSKATPGIDVRHRRDRPARQDRDARCRCSPSYQAHVWSARERKRIRKTFRSFDEAKAWRAETLVGLRRGTMRAPSPTTLRDVWETWLEGARESTIRNRSGDPYKPSVLRGYETSMRLRVLPELGGARLTEITRLGVQNVVDGMLGKDRDASTIRNTLIPLRAVCRRALARGDVAVNAVSGIELPSVRGRRDRIASPKEAAALIAALRDEDRAVWATAFYAGLRPGELLALRDGDVDLELGVIRVERSWDPHAGVIEPKSRAGRRMVPIVAVLRPTSQPASFGDTTLRLLLRRARSAVQPQRAREQGPARVEEGEARADRSARVSANVRVDPDRGRRQPKGALHLLGHSSIQITLDRYGHLMPGSEDEAVALVDAYVRRATASS